MAYHVGTCSCRNFFCPIVGCSARLNSREGFEDHYFARHTASCSVCSRVYPTQRLLSIHVSEVHDSFFQAKVARGFAMVRDFHFSLPVSLTAPLDSPIVFLSLKLLSCIVLFIE